MNRGQIRQLVRDQSETEEDDITDENLDDFIQLQYDVVNTYQDWPYLEAASNIAVNSGATTFALPNDFAHFREVRWRPTGGTETPIAIINEEERPSTTVASSGRPRFLWRYAQESTIEFWPAVSEGGDILLRYYKTPAEFTNDGDEPVFDRQFHRILVVGGLIKAYERLYDFEEASILKLEFNELLARMDLYYNRFRQPSLYGQHSRVPTGPGGRAPFSWEV